MPSSMWGIQGLNLWNILLMFVVLGWISARKREGLRWDMPRHINILLLVYLIVILIGFYRMLTDRSALIDYAILTGKHSPTTAGLLSEHLINCIKWVIPGLLLFDGCRSESRLKLGLIVLLGVYFLLAVQVIKWMPISAVMEGESLDSRSAKILVNEIGYHRVNLSAMLAGASWAIFSTRQMGKNSWQVFLIAGASLIVLFGQSLTGGQAGYATWAGVGLVLCLMRWRRYLLFAPVVVILVLTFVPGAWERMSKGISAETADSNPLIERSMQLQADALRDRGVDLYTVTSGRTVAWPYVIDKIMERPIVGYGREAMKRTGIASFLWQEFQESFPHPHNAYLELLLDNGLLGGFPVLLFYLLVIKCSISLFRDSRNSIFIATGGVALSLVLALMFASIGSQTFYPREGAVGMWCAIGLMLRVHVQRLDLRTASNPDSMTTSEDELWRRI